MVPSKQGMEQSHPPFKMTVKRFTWHPTANQIQGNFIILWYDGHIAKILEAQDTELFSCIS